MQGDGDAWRERGPDGNSPVHWVLRWHSLDYTRMKQWCFVVVETPNSLEQFVECVVF